ncbi:MULTISPECIES: type I glyceraldehyde-3-phosphate dehydrogenase [Anaerococcus]|uniref:Glyceraldehyde-3-phosphate dehydrogenase n=2 Tax=Anaerococcus vaginalis TaxID=33037 RepID=A0A6N2TWJ8_9FIRM|nr:MULTISPECIES: type I glyceraldehyde-3-phosphate dehydrogenase [Anaerococcus]MBS4888577.1 type I glyceraldehyde-3-phosphate dehydrogenase [Anaerococcus vaginalis]MBS6920440.1 type I glyceraldehyde-3-phosphate dehydrogenase [Anaerococcus vaginalis]MDU2648626.1 type I glyceraldehyde-3-phosphate dehydrogenase [Anaerococcus vaginalis]MDU4378083.1 type I glyceraldehyde-3-phosphate dehydrogenase [Anaerococcus vaginalis]MDU5252202.1 type I glyceraldehyde-3-phosphate dehydrogenase [Anaerococcus vagi
MTTKVAINGFGRIGRLTLRRISEVEENIEVVAINDLIDKKGLLYAFKYDTAQGRFNGDAELTDDGFKINGKEIKVFAERNPEDLPWKELGVDIVLECTGFFTEKEKAEAHIKAGAKKVLISAPGKGDLKTIVFGVNHEILDGSETVVSGASCTTNCLAPMVNVLKNEFGFVSGQMSTIHAYTATQAIQDTPASKKDLRGGRAAAQNTIPASTGAAKAVGKVLPEVEGKIDGSALRVPTITGSITELYSVLEKKVTVEEVNAAMKKYSSDAFAYTEDDIVSSDIIGYPAGSIFDSQLTKIVEGTDGTQVVKTVAWYDNEMGYVSNLVRTLDYLANL